MRKSIALYLVVGILGCVGGLVLILGGQIFSGQTAVAGSGPKPLSSMIDQGEDCGSIMLQRDYRLKADGGPCENVACEYCVGVCDADTNYRDGFITGPSNDTLHINTVVHVFCDDDGENCLRTQQQIDDEMTATQAGFDTARIVFDYTVEFENDARFKVDDTTDPNGVRSTMYSLYAVDPQHTLNVYIIGNFVGYAFGQPPFGSVALTNAGGALVDYDRVVGASHVLTHELGHCFGLYHTFMSWIPSSSCEEFGPEDYFYYCYDYVGENGNFTGDFCDDTPPTTPSTECEQPTEVDCADSAYAPTDYENFMGYAGKDDSATCRDHFSLQQVGRMRCWINSRLTCWLVKAAGDVDCDGYATSLDLGVLVDAVYSSGTICPLPNVGDFDCSGALDGPDIDILVDYLFSGGDEPECCTYQ